MKKFSAPSIKVKKFNKVSILTASEPTNAETAKAAIKSSGIDESNIVKITL